jgi:poly(3-hydroxybutyrate) depolymerase
MSAMAPGTVGDTGDENLFSAPVFCRRWVHLMFAVALLAGAAKELAAQSPPLSGYNIDASQTSVSGLSSGGYMAVQFEVAFSSLVRGAGIIAAGPYYCAHGDPITATSVCSVPRFFAITGPEPSTLKRFCG